MRFVIGVSSNNESEKIEWQGGDTPCDFNVRMEDYEDEEKSKNLYKPQHRDVDQVNKDIARSFTRYLHAHTPEEVERYVYCTVICVDM